MGFEVLPYEEGDDLRYPRIEITSPKKWKPRRYRTEDDDDGTILAQNMESKTDSELMTEKYALDPNTGLPVCVDSTDKLAQTMTSTDKAEVDPHYKTLCHLLHN